MLPFLEDIRAAARRISRRRRARRDLLRRFHRDRGRIHAAGPAAHGVQLRAAEQRQLAGAHPRARSRTLTQRAPQSWPCWTISNHDVERVVSRWGRSMRRCRTWRPSCRALVARLRGSVCVFQGEELGLARSRRALRSAARSVRHRVLAHVQGPRRMPHAHALGCDAARRASRARQPWLPVPHQHLQLSVAAQERDASSALHGFRRLLEWRKTACRC